MTENEFIKSIDCQFPYQDREASRNLVLTACELSANAAFAVLDEIAQPGKGCPVPIEIRQENISLLEAYLNHPLVPILLPVARRMVLDEDLTVLEAVECMNAIRSYPGQYSALELALMSCDDCNGVANQVYEQIRELWQSA